MRRKLNGKKSFAKGMIEKHQDRRGIIWLALIKSCVHSTKFKVAGMYTRSTLPCTIHEGLADMKLQQMSNRARRAFFFAQKMVGSKTGYTASIQKLTTITSMERNSYRTVNISGNLVEKPQIKANVTCD
jgi:hypothetical protein